jgi:hypothetical protein
MADNGLMQNLNQRNCKAGETATNPNSQKSD